jgi:hypothetical protein
VPESARVDSVRRLGKSLREILVPSHPSGLRGAIDTVFLLNALDKLKDERKDIRWISMATGPAADSLNKDSPFLMLTPRPGDASAGRHRWAEGYVDFIRAGRTCGRCQSPCFRVGSMIRLPKSLGNHRRDSERPILERDCSIRCAGDADRCTADTPGCDASERFRVETVSRCDSQVFEKEEPKIIGGAIAPLGAFPVAGLDQCFAYS